VFVLHAHVGKVHNRAVLMTQGTLKPGYAVHERDVARSKDDDAVTVQVTIDERHGSDHLVQRILRVAPGRSAPRENRAHEEILYAVSGAGTLHLDGAAHALEPEVGAYVAPAVRYELDNPGPGDLVLVSVLVPEPEAGGAEGPVTIHYADQEPHRAGKDREFRYIHTTNGVTQFVGTIPPGRAKDHFHLYEEVAYILEGEGVLHMNGLEDAPLTAGTCIHFPPPRVHCLENTGTGVIRVLGVFYPPGSPADAYNVPETGGEEGGLTA